MVDVDYKNLVYISSDHAGYQLKNSICNYLTQQKKKWVDLGTSNEESCDYPDFAKPICEWVIDSESKGGILICGTGIGMSMAANRYKGIRAAVCHNEYTAEMARKHNDANVLCLGARIITLDMAIKITNIFLNTKFSNERKHVIRVEKLETIVLNNK